MGILCVCVSIYTYIYIYIDVRITWSLHCLIPYRVPGSTGVQKGGTVWESKNTVQFGSPKARLIFQKPPSMVSLRHPGCLLSLGMFSVGA